MQKRSIKTQWSETNFNETGPNIDKHIAQSKNIYVYSCKVTAWSRYSQFIVKSCSMAFIQKNTQQNGHFVT